MSGVLEFPGISLPGDFPSREFPGTNTTSKQASSFSSACLTFSAVESHVVFVVVGVLVVVPLPGLGREHDDDDGAGQGREEEQRQHVAPRLEPRHLRV